MGRELKQKEQEMREAKEKKKKAKNKNAKLKKKPLLIFKGGANDDSDYSERSYTGGIGGYTMRTGGITDKTSDKPKSVVASNAKISKPDLKQPESSNRALNTLDTPQKDPSAAVIVNAFEEQEKEVSEK